MSQKHEENLEISVELDADGNVVEAHNATLEFVEATKDLLRMLQEVDAAEDDEEE